MNFIEKGITLACTGLALAGCPESPKYTDADPIQVPVMDVIKRDPAKVAHSITDKTWGFAVIAGGSTEEKSSIGYDTHWECGFRIELDGMKPSYLRGRNLRTGEMSDSLAACRSLQNGDKTIVKRGTLFENHYHDYNADRWVTTFRVVKGGGQGPEKLYWTGTNNNFAEPLD